MQESEEKRAKRLEYKREYRQANKEKLAAYNREYREANRERVAAKKLEWQQANPERVAYLYQKRHAKQRGIDWQFTLDTWAAWWGEDFNQRGQGKECLMMCRVNDSGAYHPANVYKGTPQDNAKDRERLKNEQ